MADSNRRGQRTQALNYMRSLQRPDGVTQREWVGLKAFLYLVARGQPRMVKSQETIALEMGVSIRSVKNYVRWAKDAKLLTVWYDTGTKSRRSPVRTSRYIIPPLVTREVIERAESAPPTGADSAHNRHSDSELSLRQEQSSSQRDSVSLRESVAAPPPRRVRRVEMTPRVAEALANANSHGRIVKRPRATRTDPDPARRTADYFADKWYLMSDDVAPRFNETRQWEGKGATIGVLRTTFFAPASGKRYSEEEVQRMIDTFIAQVRSSRVLIKPGQSAFMRFVGTYQRGKAPPRPADKPFKYL